MWAYGSSRPHATTSDLDPCALGLKRIPAAALAERPTRSANPPFLVEAHDWTRLPARFHREIERRLHRNWADLRRACRRERPNASSADTRHVFDDGASQVAAAPLEPRARPREHEAQEPPLDLTVQPVRYLLVITTHVAAIRANYGGKL